MRLKPSRRPAAAAAVQPLESRLLMTAAETIVGTPQEVLSTAVAPISANLTTPSANDVTLSSYFTDSNVPGTLVEFETSKGNIEVSLTDTATPLTVANFLSYVTSGAYNDTIIHRSALDAAGTGDISMSNPAGIIQGGGYTVTSAGISHIATNAPVADEYTSEAYYDIAGTIAMAKTSDADTATSEWFFNNLDNQAGLDTPTTDSNGNTTSYTVFGKVLSGMNVISLIAELPTATLTTVDGSSNPAPIAGLTQSQITDNAPIGSNNLVYVYDVTETPGTTYTVSSSDPSLVTPTVSDGVLSFTYGASQTGTAVISVVATNAYDGTSASASFGVTVPPATPTTTGPVAAADTVPLAVTGVQTTILPLSNDTDDTADAALNPDTLTIVTQPAHGTATVNGTSGQILYTATSGYTGPDTLDYTVTDTAGVVSAPTAVNITVVPAPLAVTVGSGSKVKSITFTQPDGVKGHFGISGGSAVVTFSAGTTTDTVAGSVETVGGAGAILSGVAVTNPKTGEPTIAISSSGKGDVTLGGLTDTLGVHALLAPTTTLTGALAVGGIQRLVLDKADDAVITSANDGGPTISVVINTATDSSLTTSSLVSLTSKQWIVDDGGTHVVSAAQIGTLTVTGGFADDLETTGTSGYGLTTATVTGASGEWQVDGAIRKATLTKPTAAFELDDASVIQTLAVKGDLAGTAGTVTVEAAEIVDLTVSGALTNATLETDGLFNSADTQLEHLTVGGAITGSLIATAGNIDSISARSMTASQIYAGVGGTEIGGDALPTSADELTSDAKITSVNLTAGKGTFASSEIAAYTLAHLHLGTITAANGGVGFGVSAHVLSSLTSTLDPGGSLDLTTAQTKTAALLSAYLEKHKKSLSDFQIQLY